MACVRARGCIFSKDDWKRLTLLLATSSSQIVSRSVSPVAGSSPRGSGQDYLGAPWSPDRAQALLSREGELTSSSGAALFPRCASTGACLRECVCVRERARLCMYTTELASFLSTHRAGNAGDVTLQAAAGDRRQQQPPPPRRRDWLALLIISMLAKREGPVTPPNPAAEAAATSDAQGVSPPKEAKPQGGGAGPTRAELEGTERESAPRSPRGRAGARPQGTLETCWGDPGSTLSSAFTDPPPAPRDYLSPERNPSMKRR